MWVEQPIRTETLRRRSDTTESERSLTRKEEFKNEKRGKSSQHVSLMYALKAGGEENSQSQETLWATKCSCFLTRVVQLSFLTDREKRHVWQR